MAKCTPKRSQKRPQKGAGKSPKGGQNGNFVPEASRDAKWIRNGTQMEPKWIENVALGPKMMPKWSENGAPGPKWCQNEAEMLDLLLIVGWFSADFGIDLLYGFGIASNYRQAVGAAVFSKLLRKIIFPLCLARRNARSVWIINRRDWSPTKNQLKTFKTLASQGLEPNRKPVKKN